MAEEFQAAVCGGSRWNPPRTTFNRSSCSSLLTEIDHFGTSWPSDLLDMKAKSSDDSSDGSVVFQDIQKPGGGTTTMSPDSAFQMMVTAFSNSPVTTNTDWNKNMIFRVQEGLNTFSTGDDDGSMDQQESLNFINTSYGYSSSLLQQQPVYDFQSNLNDLNFIPSLNPLRPKQQVHGDLPLANNTPFWNASAPPLDDNISGFYGSSLSQLPLSTCKQKQSCPNVTIKPNHQEIPDSGSVVKKSSCEPPFKRPRLETPSPLPTFKVRKEKLGDRITALQQLVSPFGKTDTASVLHEAIEYIKLLHDQVNILSTPYMKNGATMQPQQAHDKVKDAAGIKQDLRSLGLCLVPVSSTFPVAAETTHGFWTPSFGGSFS